MDDFQAAVKTCLRKYTDFTGRAARPEFWWFFLFQVILMSVTGMVSNTLNFIVALGLLLPGLAVGARRLHDIGKSGWFLLVGLIPFIGWLVMLYWFVQPTGPANEYGSSAATVDSGATTIAPGQQ